MLLGHHPPSVTVHIRGLWVYRILMQFDLSMTELPGVTLYSYRVDVSRHCLRRNLKPTQLYQSRYASAGTGFEASHELYSGFRTANLSSPILTHVVATYLKFPAAVR